MQWGNNSTYDAFLSAMRSDGLGDLGNFAGLAGSKSKKVFASTVAAWEAVKSLRPTVVKQAQQALAKIDQVQSIAAQARSAIDQAASQASSGDFFSVGSGIDTSGIDDAEAGAIELGDKLRSIIDDVQNGAMSHQTANTVPEQAQLDAAAGITPDWAGWAGSLSQYQTDIAAVNGKLSTVVRSIQQAVGAAQRQAQVAIQKQKAEENRARAAEAAQLRAEQAAQRAEELRQQRELQAQQRQVDAQMRQEQAQQQAEMRRQQAELQAEQQRAAMEAQLEAQRAAIEQQKLNAMYPPMPPVAPPPEVAATPVSIAPAPVVSPFPDVNYADTSAIAQNLPPPTVASGPYTQPQPGATDWFYGPMDSGGGNELFGMPGLGDMGEVARKGATSGVARVTGRFAPGEANDSPDEGAQGTPRSAQAVIDKLLSEGNIEAAKNLINALRPGTIPVAPPPEPKTEVPWAAIGLGVAGVAVATKLLRMW